MSRDRPDEKGWKSVKLPPQVGEQAEQLQSQLQALGANNWSSAVRNAMVRAGWRPGDFISKGLVTAAGVELLVAASREQS